MQLCKDVTYLYIFSGKLNVKDNELEDMLKEATGPINFTMFLNLFGEKLHGQLSFLTPNGH